MSVDEVVEGRRARQRRELLEEIEAEARRLLPEGGAGNVSMRAIARGVGMGAASLYTYFDSLDDVFTMLLLRSYKRLAEATAAATEAFAGTPPADRALAGILAHRRWALDHRHEFNLLFTDQLPGYEAPPGGPTIAAQVEVFQPLLDALDELSHRDPDLTPEELSVVVWSTFHGAVTLEVNHHLDWLDDPASVHERAVRRALASVGIPDPAVTVRRRFERWAAKQS
jgi:AcrR family transcriptional regulator